MSDNKNKISHDILLEKIKSSTDKVLSFFLGSFDSHLPLAGEVEDLSAYYKLPMFFALSEQKKACEDTLSYIFKRFMHDNGDFKSSKESKSIKLEYSHFWTYFNGWILRAMYKSGFKIPETAESYFELFNMSNGLIKTSFLESPNNSSDILTLAHYGMCYLESNQLVKANKISNTLIDLLDCQKDLSEEMFLKVDAEGNLITDFPADEQMFYSVKKTGEQLYFMTAYPCAFLASYSQKTKDPSALKAAKVYMNYMLSCENIYESRFSHKTAWAASILYLETLDPLYLEATDNIISSFIGKQDKSGLWFVDEGDETSHDQTAELGCWFLEISSNIKLAQKKIKAEKKSGKDEHKTNLICSL